MRAICGVAAAACAIFLVAAPFALKPYGIFILTTWAVMTIAAIGLNLTLGYAGQVSLAQAAFVGIGAYTTALLTTHGWPFWLDLSRSPASRASRSAGCSAIRRCACSTTTSPS